MIMVEPIFDYQFRIILVGDSTVGKSSLLRAFTEGKFSQVSDPTVGVDFFSRLVTVKNDLRVKLQLWDTAGQERFRSITRSYYRNSVGTFLLYDVTRRSSFIHLVDWLFEAQRHIEPHKSIFQVVACKADMEESREVSTQEGQDFADFYKIKFLETSAKTGYNVEYAFSLLAKDIYERVEKGEFAIQDGWDGIKTGFVHPLISPPLLEATSERQKCC